MCPNPHHQIRSDSGSLSMQEGEPLMEIGEPPFEGQTDRDGQKNSTYWKKNSARRLTID